MVDVEKALSRGIIILYLIPILLMLPSTIIIWYFFYLHPIVSLLLGIIVSWVWWSVFCPIWKLWAFQNVNDKKELYDQAVASKIMYPQGSVLNFSEIKTPAQKRKLENLLRNIENSTSNNKKKKRQKSKKKQNTNTKKGLVKNKVYLVGGSLVFLVAILLNFSSGKIEYSDLISIKAELSDDPELGKWKSDKWIEFRLEGYKKKFELQGFAYDAMCKDEFFKKVKKNVTLKVFVLKSDFESLKKENRFNNYNNVYQVEVDGLAFVSLKLMNELKQNDKQITKSLYIISMVLFLYSLIEKPKLNIYIPTLGILFLAIYLSKSNKKVLLKEYGISNKCVESRSN